MHLWPSFLNRIRELAQGLSVSARLLAKQWSASSRVCRPDSQTYAYSLTRCKTARTSLNGGNPRKIHSHLIVAIPEDPIVWTSDHFGRRRRGIDDKRPGKHSNSKRAILRRPGFSQDPLSELLANCGPYGTTVHIKKSLCIRSLSCTVTRCCFAVQMVRLQLK